MSDFKELTKKMYELVTSVVGLKVFALEVSDPKGTQIYTCRSKSDLNAILELLKSYSDKDIKVLTQAEAAYLIGDRFPRWLSTDNPLDPQP